MYPPPSPESSPAKERILVIRLGALGDLVLCFQAFHEIRQAHPGAEIALLTMPAFAAFMGKAPWFNRVIIDERAPPSRPSAWLKLVGALRTFNPTRVYDLQGKFRQDVLYYLLGGPLGPQWSGAAPLCSHPRLWPPQPGMHFIDFVAAQLRRANVLAAGTPDLKWLDASIDNFALPEKFALLIPGCGPGRDYKRWPATRYAALTRKLQAQGIASVAVGTQAETDAIAELMRDAPDTTNLMGQTSLFQLAALARKAAAVIGNDTGPTHLAAACGASTLALLSDRVDPAWSAPRGPHARFLPSKPLASLGVEEVFLALKPLLDRNV